MLRESKVVLSLGSNLGDRRSTIERAIAALDAFPGLRVVAQSSLWESPAWKPDGAEGAPDYLNAVVIARTTLPPLELLDAVHAIEDALGRVRIERYGDRTLDIDIVTIDALVSDDPALTLPHPRAHERAFVLHPWFEVEPDAQLPGHGSVAELAEYVRGDVWRAR